MKIRMKPQRWLIGWLGLSLCFSVFANEIGPEPKRDGGALDGIYQCKAIVNGVAEDAYLTLNGKSDGKTIFLVAAHMPDRQAFGGFGIGRISGKSFIGATSDGKKFDFNFNLSSDDGDLAYETVTFKGKAGVKSLTGALVNADLNCNKLW